MKPYSRSRAHVKTRQEERTVYGYGIMEEDNPLVEEEAQSKARLMIVYQMAPQDFTLGVAEDQIELDQTIEVLLQGVRLNDKKPLSSSAVLMVLSTDGTVTLMNDERVVKKGIEYSTNNVIDLNHASQAIIKEGVIQILAEQHRE